MAHIVVMGATGVGGMPAAYELRALLPATSTGSRSST